MKNARLDTYDERLENRRKAARLTLVIGVLLLIIKFAAWYLTNSAAIFSDASESIINVVTALFGMFSIYVAARPPDQDHPYGHGKVEYFSSGFEGLLILIAGVVIGYEAITAFIHPPELQQINVGLSLIVGAGVINALLGWYLIRTGRSVSSATLTAGGYHVLSDAYTSAGVFIGLILVQLTDLWWFDPLVALAIGVQIGWHGIRLVFKSVHRLMDIADVEAEEELTRILQDNRKPEWIAPHRMRTWRSGDRLYADFHMIMPYYYTVEQAHNIEHDIQRALNRDFDDEVDIYIHSEPCNPKCCFLCGMRECPVREHSFEGYQEWNREMLSKRLDTQLKQSDNHDDAQ